MRKDRLYFYTFLSIALLFVMIGIVSARFFVQLGAEQMLNAQLASSKREAQEIASLIGHQFEAKIPKDQIQNNTQKSIHNTNTGISFLSVLDWSGKRICHPDITLVGTSISEENSSGFTMNSEISPEELYELLISGESNNPTEILALNPIPESDWMVASHINISEMELQLKNIKKRFYTIFSIMGFIMILTSVIVVRLIGSLYEKNLENKNEKLESELISLSKLNSDLGAYQRKMNELASGPEDKNSEQSKVKKEESKEKGKKRILTYLRNELLSIAIDEIAYIYTENTITYVVDVTGKKSTSNSSLDELYSGLDSTFFYRANRQFIIAISSIEKIIRYGNNQLKILVNPNSEVDIIIGKNKAAEFKQWLNL